MGMSETPLCGSGQVQTVRHILNECPITKCTGSSEEMHTASDDAIKWMDNLDVCM